LETPLNFDFRINSGRQDCKTGTVCGLLVGGERVNGGVESEGIWLMYFIHI
jgi:hypothetical protein